MTMNLRVPLEPAILTGSATVSLSRRILFRRNSCS